MAAAVTMRGFTLKVDHGLTDKIFKDHGQCG